MQVLGLAEDVEIRGVADRLARWVSIGLSPYVVTAVTAAFVTFRYARPGFIGLIDAVVGICATAVVPFMFTLWMVRTGRATDIHAAVRTQRHPMFLVAIASTALATLFLHRTGAQPVVVAMGVAYCVSGTLFWVVSLFWKISLHSGVMAGSMIIGFFAVGDAAMVAAPLLPLVGWARLRRGRHTMAQVVAGTLCGALITWVTMRRFGG